MPDTGILIAACLTSFVIAVAGTRALSRVLARRGIVDMPNQRSSHIAATPRGGGIAIVAAILAGMAVLSFAGTDLPERSGIVVAVAVALAALSWIDDIRGLPAIARLLCHAVCIVASLYWLPITPPAVIQGLPTAVQYVFLTLAWLWFLNLYNFMDGIDGITGVETLVISLGISGVLVFTIGGHVLIAPALVMAAAMPGFLIWNWAPAKIFMGDVGSVPLGYLCGWLLIITAGDGFQLAALIIPGYYIADATLTLIHRAIRGEKVWQAHREHAYQKAVQNGMPHGRVSVLVGLLGTGLIGMGILTLFHPIPALVIGSVMIIGTLYYFSRVKN